jgi:hypothetical protein
LIVAVQAPLGAWTSTVSPTFLPISAEPSGDVGDTVPAPPTALTSTDSFCPLSPSMSTTDPTPTSSVKSLDTPPASGASAACGCALSKPCSFFAAWYSKFSEVAKLARGLDRCTTSRAGLRAGDLDA